MSSAIEKNAQAMQALFGSAVLVDKLTSARICVVTPTGELPASGVLLAKALADVLARLWPKIDFNGSAAQMQCEIARNAAASGGVGIGDFSVRWEPPYHCIISIGVDAPTSDCPEIRIAANNWQVELGHDAICGDSSNPVGPAFAAALAAAQIFRHLFDTELRDVGAAPIERCSFDVREICDAHSLAVGPINIGSTHIFGVGAVTHGLIWLLENWPEQVSGELHLIDPDKYGESNGQRYAFMDQRGHGSFKAEVARERLKEAHPNLVVHAHRMDINSYCETRGFDQPIERAVAGLDSAESRRHVALKLPESAINMWTAGVRVGAGRYVPANRSACLACEYLEDVSTPQDEVAQISQQTGLRPDKVRLLLDSAQGLNNDEADTVSRQWHVQRESLIGQPLRSILPVLCATGRLQIQNTSEVIDVPFAFASLFAGISGFMMLLKDTANIATFSEGWTQHIFKTPTIHMHSQRNRRKDCSCCADFYDESIANMPPTQS